MVDVQEKIEIIDSTTSKISVILNTLCSIIVVIITLMGLILFLIHPYSFNGFFISLITISIVMVYLFYQSKSKGIIRKFSLSYLDIEFLMPHKPPFNIKWSEIDQIEIILKIFEIKPFEVYELNFIKGETKITFKFNIFEFSKSNASQILFLLKSYARIKKKKFKAKQERLISGIILVEDLNV
ncbi:MAG: hypothetical protein ACFE85_05185 [Candidatus Hodarchaeota archaeon]